MGMSLSQNSETKTTIGKTLTVAAYLRSLRTGATEEKSIPRPSREMMNCK